MARKEKTIHYIYKTTCNVTGKWYVGMHSTSNLEDGYMGSGTILRYSIRKHGKDNHTKEILEYCKSRELLILKEIEIVNEKLVSDSMCMNLTNGGLGFGSKEHMMRCSKAGNEAFKNKLITDEEFRNNYSLKQSKNSKKAMLEGKMIPINESYDWIGKKHSEKSKKLISEVKKGVGIGETNSQYNSHWISKDGIDKKIKKEELNFWLNEGWIKGRKTCISKNNFSNSLIDEIIKLHNEGLSYRKISIKINIPKSTILDNIKRINVHSDSAQQ